MSQNPLESKLANSKSLYPASPIHSPGNEIKGSCPHFPLPFRLLMNPGASLCGLAWCAVPPVPRDLWE